MGPGLFIALVAGSSALAVAAAQTTSSAPATSGPTSVATSAAAVATATPAYGFVYRATPSPDSTPFPGPNPPTISEIDLSGNTLVTPGTIRVRVFTSDAVVTVAAETFGNSIPIARSAPGVFTLEGYVPAVPAFYKNRVYDVTFTASGSDGRTSRVVLPLMLK